AVVERTFRRSAPWSQIGPFHDRTSFIAGFTGFCRTMDLAAQVRDLANCKASSQHRRLRAPCTDLPRITAQRLQFCHIIPASSLVSCDRAARPSKRVSYAEFKAVVLG